MKPSLNPRSLLFLLLKPHENAQAKNQWFMVWVLCLLISPSAVGQNISLRGAVTEEGSKEGIPQAVVTVLEGEVEIAKVQTDLDGMYSFYDLEPGEYKLTANALGFQDFESESLEIKPKKVNEFNIELKFTDEELPHIEVVWGTACITDKDGHLHCIKLQENKTDSAGLKQGLWTERYLSQTDSISGHSDLDRIRHGSFVDDKRDGQWVVFAPGGVPIRYEYYDMGKLLRVESVLTHGKSEGKRED